MSSAKNFFTEDEKNAVIDAIRKVEISTSGEIRVHVDDYCKEDVFKRTVKVFEELQMHKTPFRNAVLIYIAVKDKKFAIIGDEAINQKVAASFWNETSNQLQENFKVGNYCNGIIIAIQSIGEILITHFPDLEDIQTNKLPDDISF